MPDADVGRALVGALLSRDFGEDVAANPRFREIVDRTFQALQDDPDLAVALAELRSRPDSGDPP